MSTNKTTNYELHSWVPQDDFLLTEINENFAALDSAVAAKADKSALTALQTVVAAKPNVVYGSYTGTGSTMRLQLGFTPKAIWVAGNNGAFATSGGAYGGMATSLGMQSSPSSSKLVCVIEGGVYLNGSSVTDSSIHYYVALY